MGVAADIISENWRGTRKWVSGPVTRMQPWVWLTAYVLGFGLLQVLLYRHFSGRTAAPRSPEGRATRADGGRQVAAEATDIVVCGHCGMANESHSMIRYCGSCAESLR